MGSQNSVKVPALEAQVIEVVACFLGTNFRDQLSSSGKKLLMRSKYKETNTEGGKMVEMGHKRDWLSAPNPAKERGLKISSSLLAGDQV